MKSLKEFIKETYPFLLLGLYTAYLAGVALTNNDWMWFLHI
jgi:hypothetical protein